MNGPLSKIHKRNHLLHAGNSTDAPPHTFNLVWKLLPSPSPPSAPHGTSQKPKGEHFNFIITIISPVALSSLSMKLGTAGLFSFRHSESRLFGGNYPDCFPKPAFSTCKRQRQTDRILWCVFLPHQTERGGGCSKSLSLSLSVGMDFLEIGGRPHPSCCLICFLV